ncbi:MAG TPA: hypothetical protein VFB38_02355 [Chthonomonadaceae bacterium]|nr:hypothetical protein [Chthonomonadaceae bacterium]
MKALYSLFGLLFRLLILALLIYGGVLAWNGLQNLRQNAVQEQDYRSSRDSMPSPSGYGADR